jgi:hypothetical protein
MRISDRKYSNSIERLNSIVSTIHIDDAGRQREGMKSTEQICPPYGKRRAFPVSLYQGSREFGLPDNRGIPEDLLSESTDRT